MKSPEELARAGACLNCEVAKELGHMDWSGHPAVRRGRGNHHHHISVCKTCGAWWFEDARLITTFKKPVLTMERRDTKFCACPEYDNVHKYQEVLISVPGRLRDCKCSAAEWARHGVKPTTGPVGVHRQHPYDHLN
jgi:hypothetical protein